MPDIYEIYWDLHVQYIFYRRSPVLARQWNFQFMNNLYNFGKDF